MELPERALSQFLERIRVPGKAIPAFFFQECRFKLGRIFVTPCEMEAHSPVPFCNHDCELHHNSNCRLKRAIVNGKPLSASNLARQKRISTKETFYRGFLGKKERK